MKCSEANNLFSPYLDGAVTGAQMHALSAHMQACVRCQEEYAGLCQTQQLLARVGRRRPPADLALKLRLAISREAAQVRRPRFEGVFVRLENALNAFMVPATAGLLSAVVIFGALIGFLALPQQLLGDNNDVPIMLYTAPQLQQSAFSNALSSISDDSLVIEAYVDANGRIQDYRILSESEVSQELLPQVKRLLIFTTFRPATSMGRPTSGRAVLSFSKVSVRG
jgi:hypothetical protein